MAHYAITNELLHLSIWRSVVWTHVAALSRKTAAMVGEPPLFVCRPNHVLERQGHSRLAVNLEFPDANNCVSLKNGIWKAVLASSVRMVHSRLALVNGGCAA